MSMSELPNKHSPARFILRAPRRKRRAKFNKHRAMTRSVYYVYFIKYRTLYTYQSLFYNNYYFTIWKEKIKVFYFNHELFVFARTLIN